MRRLQCRFKEYEMVETLAGVSASYGIKFKVGRRAEPSPA